MKAVWNQSQLVCAHVRLWSWQAFRQSVWNEPRHWQELMTGRAGVPGHSSSSEAVSCHLFVSSGQRCDFLCVHIMTSCTWPSLHITVHTGTQTKCCSFFIRTLRKSFFLTTVAQQRHSAGMLISHVPYEGGTISHYSLKLLDVLWVSGCLNLAPVCHRPVGRSHCAGWHEDLKVPLVCHILTHFAWQLTNQSHQSMCSVHVCVYLYFLTLQRHLASWSSPRGFQGLTSFALITATWDWADRLIFPTLHGAA